MLILKNLFYIISILLSTGSAYSQWQWQNPLPQGNILFGSNYLNVNTGWACGDGGTIIKTTNAGDNWTVTSTYTKNSIRSVFFLNENTGFACGLNGTVLNSTDGGLKWSKIILNTTGNLFCIKFSGSTPGLFQAIPGLFLKQQILGQTGKEKPLMLQEP
jgi:photosystem II stability/assembly factor-like uncharacterized protein